MDKYSAKSSLARICDPATIKESVVVGVILTIFGLIVSFVIGIILGYKPFNRLLGTILALFFTGVLIHLIFNVTGISAQYKDDDLPTWLK